MPLIDKCWVMIDGDDLASATLIIDDIFIFDNIYVIFITADGKHNLLL